MNPFQSDRGGLRLQGNRLTVAGFSFRTIGRLVNQYTSMNPFNQPRSTSSINDFQSDRGGPFGSRTIGRLVWSIQPSTSINHFHLDQPTQSTNSINHFQPDRGELRLQDNRQTGLVN
ncbi:hypothetical protein N7530_004239 [Penicillium desertorum]|uniref:Uncharacterized protein n=1 Tax=Penicillium desertorum TaxID=1303715 RepID=A0A9X0BQ89_9EURO|nr:hypothetical protein N7530_004239 [Penicillium desertorum]